MSHLRHARSFRDLIVYQKSKVASKRISEIGRMLNSMIEKAAAFCGETSLSVRESAVDYFSTDN
jgi:hypothetical protein